MEDFVGSAFQFAVTYKWWIFASIPLAIVLVVLKALNPN